MLGGPLPPHPLLQGWPQEAQASGAVPVQLAELEGSLRAGTQRGEELARAHTALPQTGLLQSRPQAPRQHRLQPWQSESLEQRCCAGLRQRRRSSGHLPILTATQGPGESCRCTGPGAWGLAGVSTVDRDPYLRPSARTGGSTLGDSTSSLRDTGCRADTGQAPRGGRARHPVGSPQTSL